MPKKGMSVDDLLSLTDAAKLLKIAPTTLRQHVHRGNITPAQKIGRNWVFRRGEVLAWGKTKRGRGRPPQK